MLVLLGFLQCKMHVFCIGQQKQDSDKGMTRFFNFWPTEDVEKIKQIYDHFNVQFLRIKGFCEFFIKCMGFDEVLPIGEGFFICSLSTSLPGHIHKPRCQTKPQFYSTTPNSPVRCAFWGSDSALHYCFYLPLHSSSASSCSTPMC